MFGGIRDRREARLHRQMTHRVQLELYEAGGNNLSPPFELAVIRKLSNERLHEWLPLAKGDSKVALERELRRREAWDAPAGKAFWISILALLVSVGAVVVSIATAD